MGRPQSSPPNGTPGAAAELGAQPKTPGTLNRLDRVLQLVTQHDVHSRDQDLRMAEMEQRLAAIETKQAHTNPFIKALQTRNVLLELDLARNAIEQIAKQLIVLAASTGSHAGSYSSHRRSGTTGAASATAASPAGSLAPGNSADRAADEDNAEYAAWPGRQQQQQQRPAAEAQVAEVRRQVAELQEQVKELSSAARGAAPSRATQQPRALGEEQVQALATKAAEECIKAPLERLQAELAQVRQEGSASAALVDSTALQCSGVAHKLRSVAAAASASETSTREQLAALQGEVAEVRSRSEAWGQALAKVGKKLAKHDRHIEGLASMQHLAASAHSSVQEMRAQQDLLDSTTRAAAKRSERAAAAAEACSSQLAGLAAGQRTLQEGLATGQRALQEGLAARARDTAHLAESTSACLAQISDALKRSTNAAQQQQHLGMGGGLSYYSQLLGPYRQMPPPAAAHMPPAWPGGGGGGGAALADALDAARLDLDRLVRGLQARSSS